MIHLTGEVVCPNDGHRFPVCVHVESLPPAGTTYTVHCPVNASPLPIAARDLRPANNCPRGAVSPVKCEHRQARRWWSLRSWFGRKGAP
jgi:hypothetical protein